MKKTLKSLALSSFILFMPFSAIVEAKTEIKDLRTEYLLNPIGIDVATPHLSWKMSSDTRGAEQTAYEISVSTDKEGTNSIWKSGKILSDKSLNIKYSGNTLQPMTRYYWYVDVWDGSDAKIASKDTAFFETGILTSGWGSAKWIKATKIAQGSTVIEPSTITTYSIKMDFEIKAISAGPCFAEKDANNYFMWQFNIESGKSLFRPHSWLGGNGVCHEDKDISSLIALKKGVIYALQIDINGDKATTYLNGIKIDENRTNPRGGDYGLANLGFRQVKAQKSDTLEEAYYDNIYVTTPIEAKSDTLFKENFSSPTDFAFTLGTVTNGRLLVNNNTYSWQKTKAIEPVNYALDMDMTLKSANAGIIFSATDANNMYMWSINTHDQAVPLIRRHFCTNGTFTTSEVQIGQFFTKADLIDHERHVKIEVVNNVIKTYIDNILVDTYNDNSGKLINGLVGFRAFYGVNEVDEKAYYDNIVLKNGVGDTLFSENFEKNSNIFEDTETILVSGNTKLNMYSKAGDTRVLQGKDNGIPMFRTKFNLDKEVASARIYASSLGIYDLFINGKRVGTPQADGTYIYDELKPGATQYSKRTYYLTYDVTRLLQTGNNAVGAQVSSGWWTGNVVHGIFGGTSLGFIAKLEIKYTDGSTKTIVTEPSTWLSSSSGPVKMGDIYNGETYDARLESNWTNTGFDDTEWFKTAINSEFKGILKGFVGPTVQIRKGLDLDPLKITTYNGATAAGTNFGTINTTSETTGQSSILLKKGETAVYDMGQNMVGWVKFTVNGVAGAKMKLRFGEMTNTTGTKSRGDDGAAGSIYTANLRTAKATLKYTLKGGADETYNPSMTYFGFRYCEITATEDIQIKSLIGQVVGSANEEGSTMETSSALVNQLYKNIIWGQRGNFLSIPTDCPQRDERQGWTGDAQIFCRTAAYNADVTTFFHKWMNDMRDSQRSDGAYPVIAPYMWDCGYGAGAWSEAGIIIPWTMYQMYADQTILEDNYESMTKYMNYLAAQSGSGYLYNGAGTQYGDWLSKENTDSRYVSVCYYAYAAQLMGKISKALSKVEGDTYAVKATFYETLYNKIKAEFQTRYVNTSGTLKQTSQTAILLALKLNMYPNENAKTNGITQLRNKIVNNGNRLSTGFVGTGTLNQTLSEVGESKTAYNLLLQRSYPSWLYSVDQGATTIWERWDTYTVTSGFNDISMNSFNHYSYGAVAEWMYRYMAGIDVDETNPGFKHIILQPTPDTRATFPAGQAAITNVKAKHCSYYGDVESKWTNNGDGSTTYNVNIPANTTATFYLPIKYITDIIYEGALPVEEAEGVTLVSKEEGRATYTLKSGSYTFWVKTYTGIKSNEATSDFKIYPNPVKDILNIAKEPKEYRIADFNGKDLLSGKGLTANVSNLNKGAYLLYLENQVFKFVKN